MTLLFLDWAIIGIFFIISLGVGIWASKKAGKSTKSYFLADRNMPWWLLGISMVANTFSTDTPNLVTDLVRKNGVNDFGFRLFVNSLEEDTTKPKYIANSATLTKGTAIEDGLDVQTITATWQVEEELMLGASNQCYGALNDDNAGTYSFQQYGDALSNSDCKVVWYMPDYMPSEFDNASPYC